MLPSHSWSSQTEVMDVGIERLAYRGTVGSLTSPLKMLSHLFHNVAVEGAERISRVAVTKVVGPTSLPLIDIRNHFHHRHEATPRTGHVPDRMSSFRPSLAARENVQVTKAAPLQILVVAKSVTKKIK